MAADDARRIRELEMMCMLLEQMLLVQEKRVWSQQTLKLLEEERRTKGSSTEEQRRARDFLESNLRVARESLDRLAHDLGYEDTSVRKVLQGEGFSGGQEVPASLDSRFDTIDAREREAGTSHLKAMYRDLTRRHDAFLAALAEQVKDDVQLNASFSAMANL
jgi:hypothetical protein